MPIMKKALSEKFGPNPDLSDYLTGTGELYYEAPPMIASGALAIPFHMKIV